MNLREHRVILVDMLDNVESPDDIEFGTRRNPSGVQLHKERIAKSITRDLQTPWV